MTKVGVAMGVLEGVVTVPWEEGKGEEMVGVKWRRGHWDWLG